MYLKPQHLELYIGFDEILIYNLTSLTFGGGKKKSYRFPGIKFKCIVRHSYLFRSLFKSQ